MLNLAGTNAKGQCAQCSVGRGVRVTTHNRHAGKRDALLWPNDMYDSLACIRHVK